MTAATSSRTFFGSGPSMQVREDYGTSAHEQGTIIVVDAARRRRIAPSTSRHSTTTSDLSSPPTRGPDRAISAPIRGRRVAGTDVCIRPRRRDLRRSVSLKKDNLEQVNVQVRGRRACDRRGVTQLRGCRHQLHLEDRARGDQAPWRSTASRTRSAFFRELDWVAVYGSPARPPRRK